MKGSKKKSPRGRQAAADPATIASDETAAPQTSDGPLTEEERFIWRYVGQSIAPIRAKPRVTRGGASRDGDHDRADGIGDQMPGYLIDTPQAPARRASRSKPQPPADPYASVANTAAKPAKPAPDLADFDSRKAKKIAKGRAGIDGRLDLHGMRQDEALMALRHFLFDAQSRGLKLVLVITGKGRETDDPSTPFGDTLDRQPRGVLRRNVPRWLDEPELRRIVVSYTSAAQRHGGDGAFYIELRKRGR